MLATGDSASSCDMSKVPVAELSDEIMKHAVPVIPDRFFFTRLEIDPEPRSDFLFVNTDAELVYDSFFDDFGPLNIAKVFRYCEKMKKRLSADQSAGRKILHYSSLADERKFLNAAWLVGAFAVIELKQSPQELFALLEAAAQHTMIGFRDASCGPSTYRLDLKDCLTALQKAAELKYFDYEKFNLAEYELYERVENGDFNWITPKFLAFCGPHQRTRLEGYPVHAPEEYFDYFKKHNVTTIVRLNSPQYAADRFVGAGFDHRDLIFPDGTSPGDEILQEFLRIAEAAKGAIAVHCKAGLGRTGTLIAAYLMKHDHLTASEAIAWVRIVRPGSVIGQQQHYLETVQDRLWADKAAAAAAGDKAANLFATPGDSVPLKNGMKKAAEEAPTVERVEILSTFSSVEKIDEEGRLTVHEIHVVETTVSTTTEVLDKPRSVDDDAVPTDDDEETTQGDALNLRKAMRDRSRDQLERCQTRSMCRAAESSAATSAQDKDQKPKKLKTR